MGLHGLNQNIYNRAPKTGSRHRPYTLVPVLRGLFAKEAMRHIAQKIRWSSCLHNPRPILLGGAKVLAQRGCRGFCKN